MRMDPIVAGAFVVLVSTAIVGFSAGTTGASFTGTTTNPGQILNTENVTPPASFTSATSAVNGRIDLVWTATTSPAGAHTLTYLILRGPVGGPYVQIGTTAGLTYSDTPGLDGTYQYVVQTKIAQGAGFFTSGNSATKNGLSDRVAPAMSITCNAASCGGGWHTSATVVVSGVDGGSGMQSVSYSLDGGANVVTNAASVTFTPADGNHTVAYFGTDAAGNVQTTANQTVKIDTVAPTAATAVTAARGLNTGDIDLTWTKGTDATSGVAGYTIHYTNDLASNPCPGTATPANFPNITAVGNVALATVTLASGNHYCFYLTTTDAAGNVSVPSNISARVRAN